MFKLYSKKVFNKTKLLAGALAGTFVFSTTGCGSKEVKVKEETTTTNSIVTEGTYTISIEDTKPFVTTSSTSEGEIAISSEENTDKEEEKDEKSSSLENVSSKANVVKYTAEDIVAMSGLFAQYVNGKATLVHQNYKFSEITPEDLYSVVYLANIDYVSKAETARLIENGIISDNINENVANSFHFYELYADDTINKIAEGKDDIMDLSMILTSEHDIEVAHLMNKIMIDSITATSEVNYKNYIDTVYYYVEGVTINNFDYDFSKSIYETDRDKLTVGGDYSLSYVASCIDEISKIKGVANKYASQLMYDGRTDFSNLVSTFNSCKLPNQPEQDKVFVK